MVCYRLIFPCLNCFVSSECPPQLSMTLRGHTQTLTLKIGIQEI